MTVYIDPPLKDAPTLSSTLGASSSGVVQEALPIPLKNLIVCPCSAFIAIGQGHQNCLREKGLMLL